MPTYPAIKTYRGGFYNNVNTEGKDDRVYTAEDIRKPYDVIFSDGIMQDADGTPGNMLEVTAAGGLEINIAAGNAKLGGAWFENTSVYTIGLDTGGSTARFDCVILRNDDNDEVRGPNIYIKSLTRIPTVADLTRDDKIYEVCLAYIHVEALATAITQANITDTRLDGPLCNVISGIGATVVRTFRNTYFSETENQKVIPIGIPQYDITRDEMTVLVEGRIFSEGVNYTITDSSKITLSVGLPVVGTKIEFVVSKNVNASAAESVVLEVETLITEMAAVQRKLEHHYYCNGTNDNIMISELIHSYLGGGTDYGSMRLIIHGKFGATSPYGGEGTESNAYYWVRAALGAASNRKVILDFTDCTHISINCDANTYNIIFFGMDVRIVGANVIATGGAAVYMFSTAAATTVHAEDCRFWITTESGGMIARSGTFKNCRASVTNTTGHSYCFTPLAGSLLRLFGGEYYAYTASSDHVSAVVGLTSGANAVAILYGVNAPTTARSGYNQTHALYQTTGLVSCTDMITTLALNVADGLSNIRGTLKVNKPGLM